MAVHIKVQKINRAVAGRTPKFAVEYQVVAPPDGMVRGGKEGVSTSARKRARQVCGVHRASDTQTQCTLTAQAPGPNRHPHLQASLCQCLSLSPLLPPPPLLLCVCCAAAAPARLLPRATEEAACHSRPKRERILLAVSKPRKHAAFAGKARTITGANPL
jgi:hypothetical protein